MTTAARLQVDSGSAAFPSAVFETGNVGIGTTTPSTKLFVNGDGHFTNTVVVGTPTTGTHAATKSYVDSTIATATSSIAFWNTGNNNIWNNNSGNVGIGITNPTSKLHVGGSALFTGTADFRGSVAINTNPDNNASGFEYGNGFDPLQAEYYNERFRVNSFIETPHVSMGVSRNYLLYTEDFSVANWVKNDIGAVTSNSVAAPSGVVSAENIPAGSNSSANVSQTVTNTATGIWSAGIWVRTQSGTSTIALRIDSSTEVGTEKTVEVDTQWRFYSVTQNFTSANANKTFRIINGTTAISLWGARLNPGETVNAYNYRTSSALTTATAGVFFNTNTVYASTFSGSLSGNASSATYSSYGPYAGFSISNGTDKTGMWEYVGEIYMAYNSTYRYGQSWNVELNLREVTNSVTKTAEQLEDAKILLRGTFPAVANSTVFNGTVPSYTLELMGKTDLQPDDVAMLVYSTTTGTKYLRLYVRLKTPNSHYLLSPMNRYGSSYSSTGVASASYCYFNAASGQAPVATLPAPAQGSIVYASQGFPQATYWRPNGNHLYPINTGNINIGTSTATSSKLFVADGNIFINDALITSGTPKAAITKDYLDSALSALNAENLWRLNGNNLFASSTDWNVGVGTTNPEVKFEIKGTTNNVLQLTTADYVSGSLGSRIRFDFGAVNGDTYGKIQTTDAGGNSASNLILQADSGNVGIGTTNPGTKFTVAQSDDANGISLYGYTSPASFLKFYVNSTGHVIGSSAAGKTFFFNSGGNLDFKSAAGSGVYFNYGQSDDITFLGGTSNAVIVKGSTGNLGIGITNPTYKIDMTDSVAGAGSNFIRIAKSYDATAATRSAGIILGTSAPDLGNTFTLKMESALGYLNNPAFKIQQTLPGGGGTLDRLIINYDGNVGVGSTTPTTKLYVDGTGHFTNTVVVGAPTAGTHAATKSYVDSAAGGGVGPGTSGQTLRHSGTAWVANSTLFNNGTNVGIGLTNPSAKLEVNGDIKTNGYYVNQCHTANVPTEGWYRIATNGPVQPGQSGGSRAHGLFTVGDTDSGQHSTTSFYASYTYGNNPTISLQTRSVYNGGLIDKIRIVERDTYEGAAVEVYIGGTVPGDVFFCLYDNTQNTGWSVVDWSDGELPAGFAATQLDLDSHDPVVAVATNGGANNNFLIRRNGTAFFNGNIGIGTSTTNTRLTVIGDGTYSIDAGNFRVGNVAAAVSPLDAVNKSYMDSAIATATSSLISLWGGSTSGNIWNLNSGNVGVGIANPSQKLHVYGGDLLVTGVSDTARLRLSTSGGTVARDWMFFASSADGAFGIYDNSVGARRMTIDVSGNIGIGTTAPGQLLEVLKSATGAIGPIVNLVNPTSATSSATELRFAPSSAYTSRYASIQGINRDGQNSIELAFLTGAGATITEKMRINSSGNIGIGVTNPVNKLSLSSQDQVISYFTGTGPANTLIDINHSNANYTYPFGLRFLYQGVANGFIGVDLASNNVFITGSYTNNPQFVVNRSSGNVGIGTTTPGTRLTVLGSGNYSIDATNYRVGNVAAPVANLDAVNKSYVDSTILWSGTKNGNIWNGDTGAGKVGLGTTNPQARLHVAGGIVMNHRSVADTNYTVQDDDYVIGYSSITTNRTITVPNALCTPGRFFVVVDESGQADPTRAIIVDPEGTTPIIGVPTFNLTGAYNSVYIFCGVNAWYIL
ncbi:hypothetical protein CVU83_00195 [Candidatus Falkowbacteria bacterium HGW-Falkowbacteria-2]|uniref:Cyclic nucleotide-binding domain-containing protein n=1 Tax=Candidatus Falkowbacteria bacterium HGW-Falkowbacteria-2 TaxID=2013769 RepID=A0A2N2E3N6_9BACT|nr:MAG: hypothetical protein CVU83_00195 [Candidatus Falkowbacteria bacterium HGW-Falkowbacteria-2]